VSELLRVADLFAFPSHFEGTPFSVLEAMAQGVPVLAARFGGADEVIEDGRSGVLVATGDADALATASVGPSAIPARCATWPRGRNDGWRASRNRW